MVKSLCSLNDRKPINVDDDVVVLVAPDYQGLADVERISVALVEGDEGPVSLASHTPFFLAEIRRLVISKEMSVKTVCEELDCPHTLIHDRILAFC